MANLGYHYIYRKLRELGVNAERFFASPIPYRSVEDDTLLERFGIIMGGVAYEGDVPVFAGWLRNGGVHPSRRERAANGAQLVGVGGAITYINPLSLSEIADFIVLGDALPVLPHIVEALRSNRERDKILSRLAEHGSILVPSIHMNSGGSSPLYIGKSAVSEEYGYGSFVTPRSAFGDTLLAELQRGCARGCKYCVLPSCFSPMRQRSAALAAEDIKRAAGRVKFSQVGLVTPEAGDYRELDKLLDAIESLGKGVSFASLRVDRMTKRIVRSLTGGGRHSLTIAPETGNDELRASCGKGFTNDEIISVLAMAKDEGVASAKLYFMIGLPGEDEGDVLSIADLCGMIRRETGLRVAAAVSPFVPKPGTAWSESEWAGERALRDKYSLLKSSREERGVTFQYNSVNDASSEYLLSWASQSVSKMIAEGVPLKNIKNIPRDAGRNETISELRRLGFDAVASAASIE
ncbi:radical SAM protein [Synergistales bacterium]|nr:radical SAM protein [Synergistales bacterium]